MTEITIKSIQFQKEREASWLELETILEKVEKKGVRVLTSEEIARLPILNRYALSSLSVARSILLDQKLLEYLESLTQRAYVAVYGLQSRRFSTIRDFFTIEFPQIIRNYKWAFILSFLLFAGGVAVGYVTTMQEPDTFYTLIPQQFSDGRGPLASTEYMRGTLYNEGGKTITDELLEFSMQLFSNNAQVGILAVSLGIFLGLPVAALLFYNGQILGAFGAAFHMHGLSIEFWAWILPHGIPEIGAIIFCGGAGLMLAQAMLFPGIYTRKQNIAIAGRKAGIIIFVCIALFYFAGLIEGIFRQVVHDVSIRYMVATIQAILFTLYLLFGGRNQKVERKNERRNN